MCFCIKYPSFMVELCYTVLHEVSVVCNHNVGAEGGGSPHTRTCESPGWRMQKMMKRMMLSGALVLCAMVAIGGTVKVPLREGWRFVKADDPAAGTNLTIKAMSDILDRADRGDTSGAPAFKWAQPGFDDSSWREVRVPHDWGVEKPFDSSRAYGDAFLDVTGVGWYRIKLRVES